MGNLIKNWWIPKEVEKRSRQQSFGIFLQSQKIVYNFSPFFPLEVRSYWGIFHLQFFILKMYLYVSPFNFQNYSRYTPSGIYQNCNTIGVTCDGVDYGMSGTLYVTLKVIVRIKQSYLLMSSIKSFFQRCVRQRDLQVSFRKQIFSSFASIWFSQSDSQ